MPLDGRSRATMESRWIMYSFASDSPLDPDALRSRLAWMDDAALAKFDRAAAYMCSPAANLGKPPRGSFLIQLREAREEWRRRFGPARPSGPTRDLAEPQSHS